mmetsp:Transcript_10638/g.26832  ORF Transcript_10638/g.26832 Transcript_10638/m.26832 type:complete len:239 (-) Transcript_10638:364-1080(-)
MKTSSARVSSARNGVSAGACCLGVEGWRTARPSWIESLPTRRVVAPSAWRVSHSSCAANSTLDVALCRPLPSACGMSASSVRRSRRPMARRSSSSIAERSLRKAHGKSAVRGKGSMPSAVALAASLARLSESCRSRSRVRLARRRSSMATFCRCGSVACSAEAASIVATSHASSAVSARVSAGGSAPSGSLSMRAEKVHEKLSSDASGLASSSSSSSPSFFSRRMRLGGTPISWSPSS